MARLRSPHHAVVGRLRALLGPDATAAGQSIGALLASLTGATVAGLTLGSVTHSLERLPGLLVLVPGAVSLRGANFGALSARLGTAVHTGTYSLTWRRDTIVGQNLVAVGVVALFTSTLLGVMAKAVAVAFGLADTISLVDLVAISVTAGLIASMLLGMFTFAMAAMAARYGWDIDNVTAPVVAAVADMVTLPILLASTIVADVAVLTPAVVAIAVIASLTAFVLALRSSLPQLRQIVRETVPVVSAASILSLIAGVVVEKRLVALSAVPALLVLVPPFLSLGGALGSILSSRLTSKLHLGVIRPDAMPSTEARRDIALVYVLAAPIFALAALVVSVVAAATGLAGPSVATLVVASLSAAVVTVTFAVAIAYYTAVAAVRLGLDPDNHGIPAVTSSMDLVGAFSLIFAVVLYGIV